MRGKINQLKEDEKRAKFKIPPPRANLLQYSTHCTHKTTHSVFVCRRWSHTLYKAHCYLVMERVGNTLASYCLSAIKHTWPARLITDSYSAVAAALYMMCWLHVVKRSKCVFGFLWPTEWNREREDREKQLGGRWNELVAAVLNVLHFNRFIAPILHIYNVDNHAKLRPSSLFLHSFIVSPERKYY